MPALPSQNSRRRHIEVSEEKRPQLLLSNILNFSQPLENRRNPEDDMPLRSVEPPLQAKAPKAWTIPLCLREASSSYSLDTRDTVCDVRCLLAAYCYPMMDQQQLDAKRSLQTSGLCSDFSHFLIGIVHALGCQGLVVGVAKNSIHHCCSSAS